MIPNLLKYSSFGFELILQNTFKDLYVQNINYEY